jgi:hypothetical protein
MITRYFIHHLIYIQSFTNFVLLRLNRISRLYHYLQLNYLKISLLIILCLPVHIFDRFASNFLHRRILHSELDHLSF